MKPWGSTPDDAARPMSGDTLLASPNCATTLSVMGWRLFMWLLEPAAFVMTRRMLIGIKRRAEARQD